MPGQVEQANFPGEVDHLVVMFRGGFGQDDPGHGPVEERQGLEEGDTVADTTASLDDAAHEGRGNGMDGGDLGEVMGETGDGVAGVWRSVVRVRVWVFAVVVFDYGVESVGH